MRMYLLFWGAAIIAFSLVEAATVSLVSIWFAVGSAAALIAALLGANLWIQTGVFLIISAVCFIFVRKAAAKSFSGRKNDTDLDRIVGTEVFITEEVNNKENSGKTRINDVEWRVKSGGGEIIPEGKTAVVEKIEGVSLVVKEK